MTYFSSSEDIILSNPLKESHSQQQEVFDDHNNFMFNLEQQGVSANINDWADFWYYIIGINIIPADTKKKRLMRIGLIGKITFSLKRCIVNGKM